MKPKHTNHRKVSQEDENDSHMGQIIILNYEEEDIKKKRHALRGRHLSVALKKFFLYKHDNFKMCLEMAHSLFSFLKIPKKS